MMPNKRLTLFCAFAVKLNAVESSPIRFTLHILQSILPCYLTNLMICKLLFHR